MNILTEKLPTSLVVDGEVFEIKSDYRTWIIFTQNFIIKEVTSNSIIEALCLVYKKLPPNPESALSAMLDFYTMNNATHKGGDENKNETAKRIFDFDIDSGLIYAAFFEQYGIDLQKAKNMHWWVFKNMLDNISPETSFGKALRYRSLDLSSIKDAEQKKYYAKMKQFYALPDNRTEEAKERSFADSITAML